MYIRDTIAAICTPLGEGGIGIIRVSGDQARLIGATIFNRKPDGGFISHRFYYGAIIDPNGPVTLDEAMLVFMQAPRSYTCEDVLEIQCHGGYLMVQQALGLVLRQGARLAEPGEFTRRAFLNGRIDLVQAEAVIDVIRGKTEAALSLAQHQHAGLISKEIRAISEGILQILALVESHIDFPEEEIESPGIDDLLTGIETVEQKVAALLDGFSEGKALREGVSVVIAGKPNVGKSSLLNALLREKRAIVTSIPGTTRDVIEEVVNIRGLPVRMLDTAGICESTDAIEREGVALALEKISQADLVLFMVDASRSFDNDDLIICKQISGKNFLLVMNKCDQCEIIELPEALAAYNPIRISTLRGEGIDSLHHEVYDNFLHGRATDSREYVVLSNVRHRDALDKCLAALRRFTANAQAGFNLELLAADLRDALHAVGEVTGKTTADDVLDIIFQRFCIGK
jgi:tRNA modification GTPase